MLIYYFIIEKNDSIKETSSNKDFVFINKNKKPKKRNYNGYMEDVKRAQEEFQFCQELSNDANEEENKSNKKNVKDDKNKIILDEEEENQSKSVYNHHISVEEIDKEMEIINSKNAPEPEKEKKEEKRKENNFKDSSNIFMPPLPEFTNKRTDNLHKY